MNHDPIVSVIIPTYNYGCYIREAIRSLQDQSLGDWECIVIDDASTDDTVPILEDLRGKDSRIRFEVMKSNRGPSAARNRGICLARAQYVQFLDADDRIESEKLEVHSQYLDQHSQVGIVYGPYAFFTTDSTDRLFKSLRGRLSQPLMPAISGRGIDLLERLSLHNIMPINAGLFRRSLLEKVGGFDAQVRGCEDWNLLLHCAISGAIIHYVSCNNTRALVRSHHESASRQGERLLQGLIMSAKNFERNLVAPWTGPPPVAFQAAMGIDLISSGSRWAGIRKLFVAVRRAGWTLNSVRWTFYGAVGALMPKRVFRRVAATPIPEELIEVGARLGRLFRR